MLGGRLSANRNRGRNQGRRRKPSASGDSSRSFQSQSSSGGSLGTPTGRASFSASGGGSPLARKFSRSVGSQQDTARERAVTFENPIAPPEAALSAPYRFVVFPPGPVTPLIARIRQEMMEEELSVSIVQTLQRLTPLLKHGRVGTPHFRNFQLSADKTVLRWFTTKTKKLPTQVRVRDMDRLEMGQGSEVFQRNKSKELEHLSFSVYYHTPNSDKLVTLDVVCKDVQEFEMWTTGLLWLIRNKSNLVEQEGSPAVSDAFRAAGGESKQGDERMVDTADLRSKMHQHTDLQMWGAANWAQLGLTHEVDRIQDAAQPSQVRSLMDQDVDVIHLSCGDSHTIAVAGNGTVYAWGHSGSGRLGVLLEHPTDHVLQPTLIDTFIGQNVITAAAGGAHTLFVTQEGTIFACGSNIDGQLGTGDTNDAPLPTPVKLAHGISAKSVACGSCFSAAVVDTLRRRGSLYMWGNNTTGQLGLGDTNDRLKPEYVRNFSDQWDVQKVSCGDFHTAALAIVRPGFENTANAIAGASPPGTGSERDLSRSQSLDAGTITPQVFTWGWNGCGQLGTGDTEDRWNPTCVRSLQSKAAVEIDTGSAHTAALVNIPTQGEDMLEGQLYMWGNGVCCRHHAQSSASAGGGGGGGAEPHMLASADSGSSADGELSNAAGMQQQQQHQQLAQHQAAVSTGGEGIEGDHVLDPFWVNVSEDPLIKVVCGETHSLALTEGGMLHLIGQPPVELDDFSTVMDFTDKDVRNIASGSRHLGVLIARRWIDDEEAETCMGCGSPFTTLRRRHHCRNCGGIFCGACTRKRAPVLKYGWAEPVRVCDPCFDTLSNARGV